MMRVIYYTKLSKAAASFSRNGSGFTINPVIVAIKAMRIERTRRRQDKIPTTDGGVEE